MNEHWTKATVRPIFINSQNRYIYWVIFLVIFLLGSTFTDSLKANLFNSVVAKAWFQIHYQGEKNNDLHDQIPDGWNVALWENGLGVYRLDSEQYFQGNVSVNIKKNTESGRTLLVQDFISLGDELECGVYHKGAEGFLRIISSNLIGRETITLPAADEWQLVKSNFSMSAKPNKVKLLLGSGKGRGDIWFDDVYCISSKNVEDNLVVNGDFEVDGISKDPLEWWINILSYQNNSFIFDRVINWFGEQEDSSQISTSFLNAADLLSGNLVNVAERMDSKSEGCFLEDGSPVILLALSPRFQITGGLAASERLAQLAINLMPNCPQSYAFLGSLYKSVYSYAEAANFYQEAAMRSLSGAQKGAYLFEQGRLHVEGTGDYPSAICALMGADKNKGWERSPWHRGAALIELGNAFAQEGMYDAAREAYQRVIDCRECYVRHPGAIAGLKEIGD
jgi:hypothetical protein